MNTDKPETRPGEAGNCLPVRLRRDAAGAGSRDVGRGMMQGKRPAAYYLDGLSAVFQPEVSFPGGLRVGQQFSGANVLLLNPGPDAIEVSGLLERFPEIRCLHIVAPTEAELEGIRAEVEQEAGARRLPEMAGYVADPRHLPEELAGRCDLVVAINVIDPRADVIFRQDVARQISRVLKLGGIFYSGGVTVRWTERVTPLSLVPVPVWPEVLKQAGYSDALPRPVFYLKHSPDVAIPMSREGAWLKWWRKGLELIGPRPREAGAGTAGAFVPRVEDGRGEPNQAPWDFLVTKPAVRRPAMDWAPKEGDRFGNLTLGTLLQRNRDTGMSVFRVEELPGVVLKIMKPFEGDIPDDPLEWDRLRKSKTLKRENGALKVLQGLAFIPQRVAHGYDPVTGWYAIVVEHEPSRTLAHRLDWLHNRRRRHHETSADVESALRSLLMLLNSLAVIHDRGLVHGDLKPGHVFLRPDAREAVVIDWGLARRVGEPLSEERRSGSVLHAPPERSDLDMVAEAATHHDLYAVGVMLLQLGSDLDLVGRPRHLVEQFFKHGCMPSAGELEPVLRPLWKWAAPVIARAIRSRKDVPGYADRRYLSARDMAEDIGRGYGKPIESDQPAG